MDTLLDLGFESVKQNTAIHKKHSNLKVTFNGLHYFLYDNGFMQMKYRSLEDFIPQVKERLEKEASIQRKRKISGFLADDACL
jgi:hypothetical protein